MPLHARIQQRVSRRNDRINDVHVVPLISVLLYRCFEKDSVCDGIEDCTDGEDENATFCRSYLCKASEFFCAKDNACIKKDRVCDRVSDCSDAADERNCTKTNALDRFVAQPKTSSLLEPQTAIHVYMQVSLERVSKAFPGCKV